MARLTNKEKEYIKFLDSQIEEARLLKPGDLILVYQQTRLNKGIYFPSFEDRETYVVEVKTNLIGKPGIKKNELCLQVTSQMIVDDFNENHNNFGGKKRKDVDKWSIVCGNVSNLHFVRKLNVPSIKTLEALLV